MAEKSAFEILKEAKQKFYAPPMAPLNWRKPATVRVGAFDLTEKEIDELIAEFESSAPKEVKSGKNKGLEITFLTEAINKVLSTTGISGISIGARDISIVARDYESARKRLQYLQSVSSRILSDGSLVYFVQDGERTANYTPEAYNKLVSDAEAAVKALEPESPQTFQGFGPTAKTYPDTPEGNLQKERDLIVQALAVQNERLANPITSRLNKNSIVKEINKLNQDLVNIDKQILRRQRNACHYANDCARYYPNHNNGNYDHTGGYNHDPTRCRRKSLYSRRSSSDAKTYRTYWRRFRWR
jgi:hypothetical protein